MKAECPHGRLICLVLAMGIVLLPSAAWAAQAPGMTPAAPEVSAGQTLYGERCSSCHGLVGEGTLQGPPLIGAGAAALDFMLSTGRMPLADPLQPALRRPPVFSRREIDALITFVTSLGYPGPPIPSVDLAQGNLVRGQALFTETCAPCHGADGQGAAVNHGQVAPSLHVATPVQIAEAIRIGPGPMPRFGDKVLDQNGLNSLVRYVYMLRTIPDSGGLGLGHEGPVIEGFVAWLVGLGLMVLVTRLIGTTT
jgi:ubiquinol-cytochrome c reductase cytochrome c subunit